MGRFPRVMRIAVMGGGSGASGSDRGFAMAKLTPKYHWVIASKIKTAVTMVNLCHPVFIFSPPSNMMLQKTGQLSKSLKRVYEQNLWGSVIGRQNQQPNSFADSLRRFWSGREDSNLRPLGPESPVRQKLKSLPFRKLQPPRQYWLSAFLAIRLHRVAGACCKFCLHICHKGLGK